MNGDDCAAIFKAIDLDGNGKLTPSEMTLRLSDFGFSDEQISTIILILDTNGDGVVSWEEFRNGFGVFHQILPAQQEDPLRQAVCRLASEFPSWDRASLEDVIRECNGDVERARKTISDWTVRDESSSSLLSSLMFPTSSSSSSSSSSSVPHVSSPTATSSLPPILNRGEYDRVMASRLERKATPKSMLETFKAAAVFKAQLVNVRKNIASLREDDLKRAVLSPASKKQQQQSREDAIVAGQKLQEQRLGFLKMKILQIQGDGNCQFRAFSSELFGTQEYHLLVRERVCKYLKQHEDDFRVYFGSEEEWTDYLQEMGMNKTWGDELTLRAAADYFGVVVHVVTTEESNWLLKYEPTPNNNNNNNNNHAKRIVFLSFLSPIHYDTLVPLR